MKIELSGLSKNYIHQEIFSGLDRSFEGPNAFLIEGGNGSGKSTLLRCLSGLERPSSGVISWHDKADIPVDKIYQYAAICAPSINIYDELEIADLFKLVGQFKPLEIDSSEGFIDLIGLPKKKLINKPISSFSSGMKQRVKLAICLIQKVPFIFLDEPCSNLDKTAITWYNALIAAHAKEKLIFVASNDPLQEASFCKAGFSLNP